MSESVSVSVFRKSGSVGKRILTDVDIPENVDVDCVCGSALFSDCPDCPDCPDEDEDEDDES